MRIISGKYKGKKLHQPIDISTRPLRDIVKERNIQEILFFEIEDKKLEKMIKRIL